MIRPNGLPPAWQLEEDWLERLGVTETEWRCYTGLSIPERVWLEAQRGLFVDYENRGLLKEDQSLQSFVTKAAKTLDGRLRESKGRAVGFKAALPVVIAYAAYCEWAKGFVPPVGHGCAGPSGTFLLHEVIPYYQEHPAPGPGAVRLQIQGYGPLTGRIGEVQWREVTIRLEDVEAMQADCPGPKPANLAFWSDPHSYLNPNQRRSLPGGILKDREHVWRGSDASFRETSVIWTLRYGTGYRAPAVRKILDTLAEHLNQYRPTPVRFEVTDGPASIIAHM